MDPHRVTEGHCYKIPTFNLLRVIFERWIICRMYPKIIKILFFSPLSPVSILALGVIIDGSSCLVGDEICFWKVMKLLREYGIFLIS